MIIKCKKCESRFNIDERILKKDGSRVRCSVCKNIFLAFPPHEDRLFEESEEDDFALLDTAEIGKLPVKEAARPEPEGAGDSFDKLFEDALEEGIRAVEANVLEEEKGLTERAYEERGEDFIAPRKAPMKGKKEGSHILLITLVVILVFIVGALIVFFLAPDILPDSLSAFKPVSKEEITDTGVRRIEFKDVSGLFLQNSKAGKIYVIKGEVINNNPKSRSYILLKGTILDENGKTVTQKLIYAGNTFTEDQLREMSVEKIDEGLKNQAGKGDINVNIESGRSVPFMIIFENLPDNLGEFEVEAVSSSPGD